MSKVRRQRSSCATFVMIVIAGCLAADCKSPRNTPPRSREPPKAAPKAAGRKPPNRITGQLRPVDTGFSLRGRWAHRDRLKLVRHRMRRSNRKENGCEYTIEYFQAQGLANVGVQRRLNGSLAPGGGVPSCKGGDLDDAAAQKTVACDTEITFKRASLKSTRLLALREHRYGDCCGCPHGMRSLRCRAYSLETGAELSIERLFLAGFRKALASLVAQRLEGKVKKEFKSDPLKYLRHSSLCLEDAGLLVVFPEYGFGRTRFQDSLEVSVNYCHLRRWIAPASPLRDVLARCRRR